MEGSYSFTPIDNDVPKALSVGPDSADSFFNICFKLMQCSYGVSIRKHYYLTQLWVCALTEEECKTDQAKMMYFLEPVDSKIIYMAEEKIGMKFAFYKDACPYVYDEEVYNKKVALLKQWQS